MVLQYTKVLQLSPDKDLEIIFEVVNLWLNNCGIKELNAEFDEVMSVIPSYKLIPLTYQIFSRLGNNNNDDGGNNNDIHNNISDCDARTMTSKSVLTPPDFKDILNRLVRRLCMDHPHHTLPLLFALAHEGTYLLLFYLFVIYLFIYLFVYLFVYLFIYLFVYLFVYLFIYLFIFLFIYLFFFYLFIYLFIYSFIYLIILIVGEIKKGSRGAVEFKNNMSDARAYVASRIGTRIHYLM